MIVHLDTSALIDALAGPRSSYGRLTQLVEAKHRLAISTLVLYEWRRGSRAAIDLDLQEELLPATDAVAFGPAEADRAAMIYAAVAKPRGRDLDLAIAACAIVNDAALWTLNRRDFDDIPGLRLI